MWARSSSGRIRCEIWEWMENTWLTGGKQEGEARTTGASGSQNLPGSRDMKNINEKSYGEEQPTLLRSEPFDLKHLTRVSGTVPATLPHDCHFTHIDIYAPSSLDTAALTVTCQMITQYQKLRRQMSSKPPVYVCISSACDDVFCVCMWMCLSSLYKCSKRQKAHMAARCKGFNAVCSPRTVVRVPCAASPSFHFWSSHSSLAPVPPCSYSEEFSKVIECRWKVRITLKE